MNTTTTPPPTGWRTHLASTVVGMACAMSILGTSVGQAATTYPGVTTVGFLPDPAPLCDGADVVVSTTTTSTGSAALISAGKVQLQIATDGLGNPVACESAVTWISLNAPGLNPDGSGVTFMVLDLDNLAALGVGLNNSVVAGSTIGFRGHYITGGGANKVGTHFGACGNLRVVSCCRPVAEGDACTLSQGFYGNNASDINLGAVGFPLVVGTGFSITLTDAGAIEAYLPATKTPGQLTSDHTDPVIPGPGQGATESGVFGGQVTTLKLNVLLDPGFGALMFEDPASAFNGMSVSGILAEMERVLGGGTPLAGSTVDGDGNNSYNSVATALNAAFDQDVDNNNRCEPTDWAVAYLRVCN